MKRTHKYELTILFCKIAIATLVLSKKTAGEICRALGFSWPVVTCSITKGPLKFEFALMNPADESRL